MTEDWVAEDAAERARGQLQLPDPVHTGGGMQAPETSFDGMVLTSSFGPHYPVILLFGARQIARFVLTMHHNSKSRNAFTLIELLVVIAIIAILAAILFPVFASARQKARDTTCLSNMKQIGLAVQQYVQDYDNMYPIYYAYNSNPSAGVVGHKGVEVLLQPYAKSTQLFKCPNDMGGPTTETDATYGCPSEPTKRSSYADCYGSSYKFSKATFSVAANESSENNVLITTAALVNDAAFAKPAETRLMRDEMFPWFSPERDPSGARYGYGATYYRQWHPTGGAMLFADGHAKYLVSDTQYDLTWKDAAATKH